MLLPNKTNLALVSVITVLGLLLNKLHPSAAGPIHFKNNVCNNYFDYAIKFVSKNCWYNPDADSNPIDISQRYGYELQSYEVQTEDGYILNIHRIRNPKLRNERRVPVFLQHGVAGASTFWVLHGKDSIAFHLADNGFDVWLGNARGTYFSLGHVKYTKNDDKYWDFSFHEMALYDIPASIDKIVENTGQKGNIIYIGHSMGTTISYVYSIFRKDHADSNLERIISLAPVSSMKYTQGIAKLASLFTPQITTLVKLLDIKAFGDQYKLQKTLLRNLCGSFPTNLLCSSLNAAATGHSKTQDNVALLPVFMNYYPVAVSRKTVEHYGQILYNNGEFRQFDYGSRKNVAIYGSSQPPTYDLSKISLPLHIFIGTYDILADKRDADILIEQLNNTKTWKYFVDFSHNDFYLAKDYSLFYKELTQALSED